MRTGAAADNVRFFCEIVGHWNELLADSAIDSLDQKPNFLLRVIRTAGLLFSGCGPNELRQMRQLPVFTVGPEIVIRTRRGQVRAISRFFTLITQRLLLITAFERTSGWRERRALSWETSFDLSFRFIKDTAAVYHRNRTATEGTVASRTRLTATDRAVKHATALTNSFITTEHTPPADTGIASTIILPTATATATTRQLIENVFPHTSRFLERVVRVIVNRIDQFTIGHGDVAGMRINDVSHR
ncbi:hypothetical protein D9M70_324010 [compost metagenome]